MFWGCSWRCRTLSPRRTGCPSHSPHRRGRTGFCTSSSCCQCRSSTGWTLRQENRIYKEKCIVWLYLSFLRWHRSCSSFLSRKWVPWFAPIRIDIVLHCNTHSTGITISVFQDWLTGIATGLCKGYNKLEHVLNCIYNNALGLTCGCKERGNNGQKQDNTAVFKIHGEETGLQAWE